MMQNYSPVFEKRNTSAHGGYISSPCRLRSTQRSPGRSMGVVDSGNAPGLNSWPSACGRSARGRREAAFGGAAWGPRAAHGQPPQTRLGPWPPRSPGPLGHPPRPSPSLVGLSHLFGTFFFFGPQGGHLHLRAKTVISDAQGGSREVWGRKGAVQGSQMDPLDGLIAGLVEGNTFFRTPFSGGSIAP